MKQLMHLSQDFMHREYTVKNLSIGTDKSKQTVQTLIRLLPKEQSDQGLHCLPFQLHLLDTSLHWKIKLFDFKTITAIISSAPIFMVIKVHEYTASFFFFFFPPAIFSKGIQLLKLSPGFPVIKAQIKISLH